MILIIRPIVTMMFTLLNLFGLLTRRKLLSCPSLKPAQKNRQDEVKFTFDVSKGDRIFDELLKLGHIKISHVIPPVDELKKRAYCKFHNSYSHATNDCNVFRRQVQSAINEGRLEFHDMELMKNPFPVNTMDLHQPKVLVRPHQAESTKGKNVLIGEEKPTLVGQTLIREVTREKSADGKPVLKVTLKASFLRLLREQSSNGAQYCVVCGELAIAICSYVLLISFNSVSWQPEGMIH